MANRSLFGSAARKAPPADMRNEAGGFAYSLGPKGALAQYAATGCISDTFYASGKEQLENVLKLAKECDDEFIAKCAVYARQHGHMKDMPALLLAVLTARAGSRGHKSPLLEAAFRGVVDNGKMLRNFVQIIRSGVVDRKSFGTQAKRLVLKWLESRNDNQIFRSSVGNDPSLADIVKMVHPKPSSESRRALYGHLLGREPGSREDPKSFNYDPEHMPPLVKAFEAWKRTREGDAPSVPWEMLTALDLSEKDWKNIALNASWTQVRMNLNTFTRHGVFEGKAGKDVMKKLAAKLRDPDEVRQSRCFPYQLLAAFLASEARVPEELRLALQDAMEVAIENVPAYEDQTVFVFPDVSGSMHSPVTGYRPGAATAVMCVHVAALISACVLRRNPTARVIPFHIEAMPNIRLNPRDSVMTNAALLAGLPSGGTSCSAPLRLLNEKGIRGDLLILVSDNQSWVETASGWLGSSDGTKLTSEWLRFKGKNKGARLVCMDLQPGAHTQARDRPDTLNVGGFSDAVFGVIGEFAKGGLDPAHWIDVIERVGLGE